MAIVLWSVMPLLIESSASDHALQELVAGHVRSLMVDHLTDVTSSDSHTVKPWFEGKLDFSPPVPELSDAGISVSRGAPGVPRQTTGRGSGVPAPGACDQSVYMACPARRPAAMKPWLTRQGYHLAHWQASGMSYWAVSNLNQAELQEFVRAVRQQTSALPL